MFANDHHSPPVGGLAATPSRVPLIRALRPWSLRLPLFPRRPAAVTYAAAVNGKESSCPGPGSGTPPCSLPPQLVRPACWVSTSPVACARQHRERPRSRPSHRPPLLFRHVAPSRRAPSRTRAWGSSAQRQPIAPPSRRAAERRAAAARASRSERATSPTGARSLGRQLAADHGWSAAQFTCLDSLWTNESGWQIHAQNSSGAYGIPQALPGTRMSTAGSNWRNSAETQIRWGLDYIDARYGSPCGAYQHWRSHRWY